MGLRAPLPQVGCSLEKERPRVELGGEFKRNKREKLRGLYRKAWRKLLRADSCRGSLKPTKKKLT